MKTLIDNKANFISGTKRPFGIKVSVQDVEFHIFLKKTGKYEVVNAKPIGMIRP